MELKVFDFVSKASPFLFSLFLLFLGAWVYSRAGTLHFLYSRIWNFIGGKREINDVVLKRRWEEIIDMEFFRFQTGIKFRGRDQLEAGFGFVEKYGLIFGELCSVAPYYDPENVLIKNDSYIKKALLTLGLVLLWVALFQGFSWFAGKDSALLVINESRTYFWSDGSAARLLWDDSYVLNRDSCNNMSDDFSDDDRVICSTLMGGEELDRRIGKTILEQKVFGWMFCGLFLGMIFYHFSRFIRIVTTLKVIKKIKIIDNDSSNEANKEHRAPID